jgi:hypothetical protein
MKCLYFIALYFILFSANGQVLTQGPLNAANIVNSSCSFAFGGTPFTSPANAISSDNLYASATHCECCDMNTQCLTATNFGFSVPATATINGITVEIERRSSFNGHIYDNGLRLLKGGVEVGSNYMSAVQWSTTDTYTSYGGCSDLWGTTWTPADINAANFGLVFACIDYCPGMGFGSPQSFIDHVRITVCYTNSLPVLLHSFEVKAAKNKNIITWQASENDVLKEYELEKTEDNEARSVYYVSAGEFTKTCLYEDKIQKNGEKIYRLYGIHKDGTRNLLAEKSIWNTLENDEKIKVIQAGNRLRIQIYADKNIKTLLQTVDICGKTVLTCPVNLTEGWNYIDFPVHDLTPGVYFFGSPYTGFGRGIIL